MGGEKSPHVLPRKDCGICGYGSLRSVALVAMITIIGEGDGPRFTYCYLV